MDEEFDTGMDTSDVDTSSDMDTSDIADDVPDDIPEDIPEDEPEMIEEDDFSDDISEDIPEDEPEMIEEDDISDDIPEDVPEEDPEMLEEDDMSDDIAEDVPEEDPEMLEEDDMSDDIPEDVPEDEPEMIEENDMSDDIPEDVPEDEPETLDEDVTGNVAVVENDVQDDQLNNTETEETAEDTTADADNVDSVEQTEDTQGEQLNDTETEETAEDTTADADNVDSVEETKDTQDEQLNDTETEEAAEDKTDDTNNDESEEQTEDSADRNNTDDAEDATDGNCPVCGQNPCVCDETKEAVDERCPVCGQNPCVCESDEDEAYDESQDGPSKVLKRDELELLKSGNDAINQRLEAQADDYRDKGMNEDEISDRLAADKWNFQKEFLEDAFPGQDVSPDVFNGFLENGAKDRISEINQSESLRNQLDNNNANESEETDTVDNGNIEQTENTADKIQDSDNAVNEGDDDEEEDDGTDWSRTSLRPEEEAILKEMQENGEIDFLQENPELEDPEEPDLHLPTEKTGEFLGERGNSEFRPKSEKAINRMSEYGKDTVLYKNGHPDFSPFTKHNSDWGEINGQVEIGHMTDQRENAKWEYGRRPKGAGHDEHYDLGNFAQADNAVAAQLREKYPDIKGADIEKYRKANKLTWHECADGKTMQLVPEEIHDACRHSGGVSEMKYQMSWGDVTRTY